MEFFETLLAVVAPHRCINCNSEGSLLCSSCRVQVPLKRPTCFRCNRLMKAGRTCATCRRQSDLAGVVVAAPYDGMMKDLVQALKYNQQIGGAKIMAELLTPLLPPTAFDVVTAIPGSPSRYRHRGYHQAELIAKRVATRLGLPYRPLIGRLEVQSQVGASRSQRLTRVHDSFWIRRSQHISDQRILIIDDVLTTGATLSEAARVLKDAGAKSVWGAVAAKH